VWAANTTARNCADALHSTKRMVGHRFSFRPEAVIVLRSCRCRIFLHKPQLVPLFVVFNVHHLPLVLPSIKSSYSRPFERKLHCQP